MSRLLWRVLPAVAVLAAPAPGCGRDDPGRLLNRARDDFSAGRLAEAEADLARLAAVRPLTVPERLLRSQVARDRGRLDEALAALNTPPGPSEGPEAAVLASSRGTLELVRHRFRAAEAELTRALALDPGRAEARRELINLYALQGRSADMAAQFRALGRSAALTFDDLYLWALGRRENLGPAEVAEALGRAVRADPDDRASRLALAENLRRLGRLDEAESALSALPTADPDARATRARVALDRGDDDQAEALLARSEDDHPASNRLRGRLALARGDTPTAVRRFRAALEAAPDDRDTRFGLGQALRLAGDTEAARPHAQAARDRDRLEWLIQNARPPARRDDPKALRPIADACRALGRRDEARAWLRLALRRDPLNADLQKALFELGADPTP